MALQIWLPLNGNIENKGLLGDLTVTATPTFADAGKIGKCLSSGSLSMSAEQTQQVLNNDEFTFATWLYLNSDTGSGSTAIFGNEGMTAPNNRRFTVFLYDTLQKVHLSWQNYDSNSTVVGTVSGAIIPLKQWTHLAVTYSKSSKVVKVYLNGAVKESYNVSGDFTSPSYAYVTRLMPNNSSIRYNDYRVYSHCLSPKEVKEISKGLVLHYKMDDKIATNLVKNHQYNIYNNHNVPASLTKLSETFQGCDVYRLSMTPTSSYIGGFQTELWSHGIYGFSNVTFKANTKYCFWIYYRPVSHSDVRVGGTASNISGWYEIPPTEYGSGWKVVGQYRNGSVTSDKTDNIFTSFYCPSAVAGTPITIDFCCPHLIEGCSEIIDDGDYQEVNPHTTIYDCSGFEYNGTVTSATAPISDSNNSRYNSCFNFNTNAKYITTAIDTSGYKDTYSIAWWGNIPNFGGAMFWGFNNMMNWYDGKYWNQGDGGNNPFYSSGTTTITPPSTNTWHHYVITGDGSVTKLYVDGALYGTAKTYRALGGTSLQINGWPNDANYRIPGMKMSDFRIYATPLSVEDIKELYNTSTVICDNGTVMAYSLEE